MNKSTRLSLLAGVALLACACGPNVALGQTSEDIQPLNAATIADNIIVGLLSEEQFDQLKLTPSERLEVFKQIKQQRGWKVSDEDLQRALEESDQEKMPHRRHPREKMTPEPSSAIANIAASSSNAVGACNQYITMEEGYTHVAWPIGWARPWPGECGSDKEDIIIGYNTPNYPLTNTANVRSWSPFWWVRAGMRAAYPSGGMAANGLCSTVTRACIGSKGQFLLGPEIFKIYIWQK